MNRAALIKKTCWVAYEILICFCITFILISLFGIYLILKSDQMCSNKSAISHENIHFMIDSTMSTDLEHTCSLRIYEYTAHELVGCIWPFWGVKFKKVCKTQWNPEDKDQTYDYIQSYALTLWVPGGLSEIFSKVTKQW